MMVGYDLSTQELACKWFEENDAQSIALVHEADMTDSLAIYLKFMPGGVNDKVLRKRILEACM